MKNRNKKVAETGKYTVNYIYDIVKTSLIQDPYQFFLTQYGEEKAHQIINA
ncbi:hypothetical protein QDY71_09965 [Kingella negevensis]|uniref:hypothetical protein n=1 Tax=Kingella negevensis TaxID=1522312 RepID=UPI0015DAC3A9|nr:hypothetical protein [Kingella negevensis]MDK4684029.1 hypothetical protein [Kingella negevensis]MDK4698064.1 hypothetical protein [Kingella negevensis]MDK4707129.1 hypothetical protein [Kingella negevensis]MDK4710708.1 hypothetical protein [Kingella negevensis]WII93092.1 hypothetical protein QEO94_10795 [Kingella negevensis]